MATFMIGLEFENGRKFSRGDVLELPDSAAHTIYPGFYMGKPRKPVKVVFDCDVEFPVGNHILNLEIDTENSHVVSCMHYDGPSEQQPGRRDFLLRVYAMFPNLRGASFAEVIDVFEEHCVPVQITVDGRGESISSELRPFQYEQVLKATIRKKPTVLMVSRPLTSWEQNFLDKMHNAFPNLSGYGLDELVGLLVEHGIAVGLSIQDEDLEVEIRSYPSLRGLLMSIPTKQKSIAESK